MAAIAEVFEIEKQRIETKEWNVIHLFKEGNFYHAYEWSAFLIAVVAFNDAVRMQTPERKPLSVTHKKMKNSEGTFAFVGFPLNSVEKYIPKDSMIDFKAISDTLVDIYIELPAEVFPELSEEIMQKRLAEWKEQYPVKEEKKKQDAGISPQALQRPLSITGVMAQVLAYPLERKSPMEAYDFVSELKRQLATII